MKKLLIAALTMSLVFSFAACGSKKEDNASEPVNTESTSEETQDSKDTADTDVDNTDSTPSEADDTTADQGTLGSVLLEEFKALMADGTDYDTLTLANKLVSHESIEFMGDAFAVEPGYLSGFNNYEVTGFESGAQFGPMIGSIAFVGYVFELPADADVDAFVEGLKENADLRWNICVEADEMIAEASGNTVFFLMCPNKTNNN